MEKGCFIKKSVGIYIISLSLFLFIPSAWGDGASFLDTLSNAKGNLKIGELRVHLGMDLQEKWDDNIFLEAVDEKHDYITTITPGLLLSLGTTHIFELGYAPDVNYYHDYTDENFTAQHGKANISLNFPGGITIDINDRYSKTKDPRDRVDSPLRASHWSNDINSSIRYVLPAKKLAFRISYSQYYLKYDQSENKGINRVKDSIGAVILYKFLPKTGVFVEYEHGITNYFDSIDESTDKDSKSHAVNLGLDWDVTSKLVGTLKSGWKQKTFDNRSDPSGNKYNDKKLWSVSGILAYNLSNRTRINILLNRSIEDTDYIGNAVTNFSKSSYYMNTGGKIGITQKLNYKMDFDISIGYQKHKYNDLETAKDARDDRVIDFNTGLQYRIRKLLFTGLNYTYSDTESKDDNRDQSINRVMINIGLAL